jgi:hypothetical protein
MNFPKLFCPILYHKWLDAIQQARFSLISIDIERDSNPIRFKLWEVHAETGHYPLQELNIQEQRRDPSVQIGAWSVIANSVSQAAARSYINYLKDQLADLHEDVDTCEIEEEIHLWKKSIQIEESIMRLRNKLKSTLSSFMIENLILNALLPFLYRYSINHSQEIEISTIISAYSKLPAENNTITRKWNKIGINLKNAYESQASLEIYQQFCLLKKCAICEVGKKIMKK